MTSTLNKTWDWVETKRYRSWFGTLNNYTDDQYMQMITACEPNRKPICKYVVVGKEIGEQNGVHHLHCYIVFKDAQYQRVISNKYRNWVWEPTKPKATVDQTIAYVTKGGQWEERGTKPVSEPHRLGGDATKAAWERTKELAKEGRLDEIEGCHYVTNYGNLKRIEKDHRAKPSKLQGVVRKVRFEWWFGEPGTGKSYAADQFLEDQYGEYFDKPAFNKWIDDSIDPGCPWRINDADLTAKPMAGMFKIWAEESPFRGEDKCTNTWFRPEYIIVTSNFAPWEIWGDDHKNLEAIVDRFKIVWWPRNYTPDIYKYDPRIDEIRAPWNYAARIVPDLPAVPPPVQNTQYAAGFNPPVLNRTVNNDANVGATEGGIQTIWTPDFTEFNQDDNRLAIRSWLENFDKNQ